MTQKLRNSFLINSPYGLKINEQGKIYAFNRDYKPIGFAELSFSKDEDNQYIQYVGVTQKRLLNLAWDKIKGVEYHPSGKISMIYFYHDFSRPDKWPEYTIDYYKRLHSFYKFKVKFPKF